MRCIILNRVDGKSLYKRALHEVLKTKGDTLILGYGYISDNIFLEETFIRAVKEGFNGTNEINEIILVGCKNVDCRDYINVAEKLEENFKGVVIKLLIKDWEDSKYLDKNTNEKIRRAYHKKVAIKLDRRKNENDDYTIKIGLLGSSNLTNPAYRDSTETYIDKYGKITNYEVNSELDILMWNPYEIKEDLKNNINRKTKNLGIIGNLDKSKYKLDLSSTLQLHAIINEVYNYRDNNLNMIILDETFPHSYIKQYFELNCYKEDALKKCLLYYYLQQKEEEGYSKSINTRTYICRNQPVNYNQFKWDKEKTIEANKFIPNKSKFIELVSSNETEELIKYILNNSKMFKTKYEFMQELIQLYNESKKEDMIKIKENKITGQLSFALD